MNIPDFSKKLTYGEALGPAMKITDQAEADQYFEAMVQAAMKDGKIREEAERISKSNLGYFSGYYDQETMARVQKLFNCVHPIFGAVDQAKDLTTKDILEMGMTLGKKIKKGQSIETLKQPENKKKSTEKARKIRY